MTITPAQVSQPLEPATRSGRRSWATARTVVALMLREMSTRYGQNPGGYVWAVLEPLGAIIILSFGFSLMMRSPSLGSSFLLFYSTGYIPFHVYNALAGTVARSISFSKPLLQYPAVTWLDAILARFLLNALTGFLVGYILMTGILAVTESRIVLDFIPIVGAMALAALLGLGMGTLNCALGGVYPTWDLIWSIITRPLFIVSGIFYIYEDLPHSVQVVLDWNPLIHITGLMRSGFFPMYRPQYIDIWFVLGVSLATLFMGLVLLGRYHRDILNR